MPRTGRPRLCEHGEEVRRQKVIVRAGRPYTVSFCRTCESALERDRARARRAAAKTA